MRQKMVDMVHRIQDEICEALKAIDQVDFRQDEWVREALEEYKDKFYTYISLSSPHMGYMYNNNTMFNAGFWFLKQWRKSKSLA